MGRGARILSLCVGLSLLVGDLPSRASAAPPQPEIVLAQAERGKRPGIFRFLFRNRRPRLVPMPVPAPQPQQARPRKKQQKQQAAKPRRERKERRERRERRQRAAAPAAPVVQAVEKAPDAKRLLVVGDFMAGALAKGLDEAYEENANVLVIDANNGSSGLVRDDYYDWPGALPGLAAEHKPDVLLVLIGANDRQPIATPAGSRDPGTEEWRAAYAARVGTFANVLAATGKPVLWAGLPPARQNAMARDYSAFNGIVREQLEGKAPRFVETWNGFADEEGQFIAVGPDVGGQSVQLRAGDGINFTRAGQRKLAYFAEQQLKDILIGATPLLAAVSEGGAAAATEPGEAIPKIGPMVPIDALKVGGASLSIAAPGAAAMNGTGAAIVGDALSLEARTEAAASIDKIGPAAPAGAAPSGSAAEAIVARLASATEMAPPFGRADNYEWPRRPRNEAPAATPAAAPLAENAAAPSPLLGAR